MKIAKFCPQTNAVKSSSQGRTSVPATLRALISRQMLFFNTAVSVLIVPAIWGRSETNCFFLRAASMSKSSSMDIGLAHTLRKQLGERLPAYMLPRKFVFLDAFPMTANGKADRTRLAKSL